MAWPLHTKPGATVATAPATPPTQASTPPPTTSAETAPPTTPAATLEQDPTHDTRDRYGRLLAYVWLEDRTFFNKQMIAARYAQEYTYSTPYRYQTDFKAAQQQAREAQPGLWAPDTRNGDTKQPANAALAPIARPRCQCDRGSPRCHGAEYGSARDGAVQHRLELEFVNGAVVRLGREVLRILDRDEHAVAVCEQLTPERLGGLNEPGTIGHGSQRPTARYVVERRPLTRPLH